MDLVIEFCLLFFTPDFDLSDVQREHALAVEQLSARLRALRIELCPRYMTESSFWKIYFVLLHPRLECDAAELLSTPNVSLLEAMLTLPMLITLYTSDGLLLYYMVYVLLVIYDLICVDRFRV